MRASPLLARRKVARRSDQEKWFIVMSRHQLQRCVQILPLSLREGVGGGVRTSVVSGCTRTPPPGPLPQGEGEDSVGAYSAAILTPDAGRSIARNAASALDR